MLSSGLRVQREAELAQLLRRRARDYGIADDDFDHAAIEVLCALPGGLGAWPGWRVETILHGAARVLHELRRRLAGEPPDDVMPDGPNRDAVALVAEAVLAFAYERWPDAPAADVAELLAFRAELSARREP